VSIRRVAGAVVLALIATLAPVSLSAIAPAATAAVADIDEGTVTWGLRESFRNYIGAGGITLLDGLTRNSAGEFVFPVESGSYDDETKTLSLDLAGGVNFSAHEGALDLRLADVEVVIDSDQPAVFAEVSSLSLSGELVSYGRVAVGELDLGSADPVIAGGRTTWTNLRSSLSADAAAAFAGFYLPGAALDPVDIDYAGPGGEPTVSQEPVVASGAPSYELAAEVGGLATVTNVIADTTRGVVHVQHIDEGAEMNTATLSAYDATTLEPLDTAPAPAPNAIYPGMVLAPGTGDVIAPDDTTLTFYAFDPEDGYTVTSLQTGIGTIQEISYDQNPDLPNERVLVLCSGGLLVLNRDDAAPTGWTPVAYPGTSFNAREAVIGMDETTIITTHSSDSYGMRAHTLNPDHTLTSTRIQGVGIPGDTSSYNQPSSLFRVNQSVFLAGSTSGNLLPVFTDFAGGWTTSGDWTQATSGAFIADRQHHTSGYPYLMLDYGARRFRVWHDGAYGDVSVPGLGAGSYYYNTAGDVGDDGSIFVASSSGDDDRVLRYDFQGYAPYVYSPTQNKSVTLGEKDEATQVSFGASFSEMDHVRWQTRLSSTARWADIPGETAGSLSWTATRNDNGRQFRALAAGEFGTVSAGTGTITVNFFPIVAAQPTDVAVDAGQDALLKTMPSGYPYPAVTWQRRVGGYWEDIAPTDENFVTDSGYLTVREANVDQSGSLFRARLRNTVGTTWTRPVALTVTAPSTDPRPVVSGVLDWGIRESFRSYIVGPIADGSVTVADGAIENADGSYGFPVTGGLVDPVAGTTTVQLGGSVHFVGHTGPPTCATTYAPCLDITVARPRLEITEGSAVLVADVTSKDDQTHAMESFPAVELVTLDLSGSDPVLAGGALSASDVPTALTAAGAEAFAGFYAAGAAFDPLSLSADLGAAIPEVPVTVALNRTRTTYGAPVTATVTGATAIRVNGRRIAAPSGTARLPRDLPVGNHTVTAGTGGVASAELVVSRAGVRIQKSARGQVRASKRATVRVTATLIGASGLAARGQVQVLDGERIIAVGALSPRGTVAIRLPRLAVGRHLLALRMAQTATQEPAATAYWPLRVRRR
jgi:hypothetical protein